MSKKVQANNGSVEYSDDGKTLIAAEDIEGHFVVPDSVTVIGDSAFSDCSSLSSITIQKSVTTIGNYAFNRCTSLTSIKIPKSVTKIGYYAFRDCRSLTSPIIVNDMFVRLPMNHQGNYTIPEGIKTICGGAFQACRSLSCIEIPNSVTEIEYLAFSYCSSLSSILIPDYVKKIGSEAFYGCSSISNILIPNYVEIIRDYTFSGCSSLTSIEIPNSVTVIGDGAFSGCSSLTSIEIPTYVTKIGSGAFYGCSSLTSIKIPNSVTKIGDEAFHGCSSLTSIEIPNSVTVIGDEAFDDHVLLLKTPKDAIDDLFHLITQGRSLIEELNQLSLISDSFADNSKSEEVKKWGNSIIEILAKRNDPYVADYQEICEVTMYFRKSVTIGNLKSKIQDVINAANAARRIIAKNNHLDISTFVGSTTDPCGQDPRISERNDGVLCEDENNNRKLIDEEEFYRLKFDNMILSRDGSAFEDLFSQVMHKENPNFMQVKPQGKLGDKKNDGFDPTTGTFYQVYAPEDLSKNETAAINKLKTDFNGLLEWWPKNGYEVKHFYYVINDKGKGIQPGIWANLTKLKDAFPDIEFGIIDSEKLKQWFNQLPEASKKEICSI